MSARSVLPDATIPRSFALGLLESAPPNAVLFTWGDNDTYPLWYAREVEGIRRDLVLVTVPLLPADWYRAELARRSGLLGDRAVRGWLGQDATLRGIASAAKAEGRPVAVVITMPADDRAALGSDWSLRGLVYVAVEPASGQHAIDTAATRAAAERLHHITSSPPARTSTDPTARYVRSLMECPRAALASMAAGEAVVSLAPVCNLR